MRFQAIGSWRRRWYSLGAALPLAALAGHAGCAGRPPPDVSALPSGAGWHCTAPYCERTPEGCEAARVKADRAHEALVQPWQGSSAPVPECEVRQTAACYTYHDVATARLMYRCYGDVDDCKRMRDHYEPVTGAYEISACAFVP